MKKLTIQVVLIVAICVGLVAGTRAYMKSCRIQLSECRQDDPNDKLQPELYLRELGRHLLDFHR